MSLEIKNHVTSPLITIKNVGPIKSVKLELNQINIFIGPQSSGKSTIAKIVSFCSWIEKDFILNYPTHKGEKAIALSEDLIQKFKDFHRLSDEYFSKDSLICYKTNTFNMEWHLLGECHIKVTLDSDSHPFQNKKIAFIPAERNLVSVINVEKYSSTPNNITNFIDDWYTAKSEFRNTKTGLKMDLIDADYYFDEQQRKDWVVMKSAKKEVPLMSASSGIQSIVPLLVLMQHFTKTVYKQERSVSPIERIQLKKFIIGSKKLPEDLKNNFLQLIDNIKAIPKALYDKDKVFDLWKELIHAIGIDINYAFTRFIIEEPEQNLFPRTQRDLIYQLLSMIQNSDHHHEMIITTHSPYILYALNNCMLGGLVKRKMSEENLAELQCKDSLIEPSKVSAYQIKDGEIVSLQNEDGLIGANFLDANMKEIMDDFYSMLEYYEEDEEDDNNE